MDSEDQEAPFHSYPFAYYVQSPSNISHGNSPETRNAIPESPIPNEASRLALSHYSSRGSNHYFLHEKKLSYDDGSHETTGPLNADDHNRLIIVDCVARDEDVVSDDDDYDDEYFYRKRRGWWNRYCSYRDSDPCVWICLQIIWRLFLSLSVALFVFYLATKPPAPKVSIKVGGIPEFGLGEGVDRSGVTTKILSLNCTLNLIIDNNSKLFALHIHPPSLSISFERLTFATYHGPKLYAESGRTRFPLHIGTRNKPLYGAGRDMEDMLRSGNGMPLRIKVSFSSSFRVVLNLIKPKFHHQAHCLLLLHKAYDKKHQTQHYNSLCRLV
ncbi:hypothetical protein UlMin_007188 [Ulmus minor]